MELITQRGNHTFLVKKNSDYYLINTQDKKKWEVNSPEQVYRQGYCEEPHPTDSQIEIINKIIE